GSAERLKTEDWPILFAQSKKSAIDEEQEFFLKRLHKSWGKSRNEIQTAVDAAVERYGWMTMSYYNERPKTSRDYWREIQELKALGVTPLARLRQMERERRVVLMRRERLYKKIRDKKLERIIKLIQEATYIKDSLRVYNAKLVWLFERYFAEIGRRAKVPVLVLKQLLPEEMEALIRRGAKPDKQTIKKRAGWHVAGLVNNRFTIWYGAEAQRITRRYFRPQKSRKGVLQGRVACAGGTIKGTVSIIRGAADFGKFKPGSIIVAANTTPNYVPLLKKCKALICEEGGLTIHAAVISRELGIPCVVGIPDLLFLVKDGDRVEVDAEKGVVKKL
ncbi:MAG: hypothetical protein HYS45_02775, partial [Parcubacteria group bacterium]|nr:hypothetical protein [Parcubacteria group bacterium]